MFLLCRHKGYILLSKQTHKVKTNAIRLTTLNMYVNMFDYLYAMRHT